MTAGAEYEIVVHGIRALFFIGVPILIAVSLLSTIIGAFQAATTLQEPALGHAARVLALVLVLYLMFPAFARTCINLAELAFR